MQEKFITAYASVQNNIVYKNGIELFTNKTTSLQDFFLSTYDHLSLNYPKFYKMDNLSKLGFLASEILLQGKNLHERYHPQGIGIVLSNSNASLDADLNYSETIKDIASPALFVYTLPNIVVGEIAIRNNFKGENAFFISDTFDTAFIEQYVNTLFNSNAVQSCIIGWADILKDDYQCVLYLIEKEKKNANFSFTDENLQKIFNANA